MGPSQRSGDVGARRYRTDDGDFGEDAASCDVTAIEPMQIELIVRVRIRCTAMLVLRVGPRQGAWEDIHPSMRALKMCTLSVGMMFVCQARERKKTPQATGKRIENFIRTSSHSGKFP